MQVVMFILTFLSFVLAFVGFVLAIKLFMPPLLMISVFGVMGMVLFGSELN